jgi:hypothetical protein
MVDTLLSLTRRTMDFDDQGQELVDRRYVGAGAGQLTVAPADG